MKNPGPFPQVSSLLLPAVLLLVSTARPAQTQDELLVAKDTLKVEVRISSCKYGDSKCAAGDYYFRPTIGFQVIGTPPSGSQFWVHFSPTGKKPLKYDCQAEDVWGKENRKKIFCNVGTGSNPDHGVLYKGVVPAGVIPFTLGVRNELMETNTTVYTGKFKLGIDKRRNPKDPDVWDHYVDEDWRLPIGYLYFDGDRGLHIVTWFRGSPGGIRAFLFHQGKEIAKNEGCGVGDERDFDPNQDKWWEINCEIVGVYWNTEGNYDPHFVVAQNAGEYEIKMLVGGKLGRAVTFTVADGAIDNSLVETNKVGTDRYLLPVRIIGDQGKWNKLAWKTEAFYGNPLAGFTPPQ